jgi:hypothetical protein
MFFYDRKTRHVDCCSMYTNGVSLLTSVTKRLKDGKMLLMSKWIRANIPVGFGRLEAAHTTCNAVERNVIDQIDQRPIRPMWNSFLVGKSSRTIFKRICRG